MSLDPAKASRFGHSRARTGCKTCLNRHLKCDEAKPICAKCSRAGRLCEQRQDTEYHKPLRIIHYTSDPPKTLSVLPSTDLRELKYFELFRVRTSIELSGAHLSETWPTVTSQVATREPAIWHAVLALAAAHEWFEADPSLQVDKRDISFALAQYGKAIQALLCAIQTSASSMLRDLPLLACTLFCAFESIGYHLHSALSHVSSGLRLYSEGLNLDRSANPFQGTSHLLDPLFTRLDTQRLQLGDAAFSFSKQLLHPVYGDLRCAQNISDLQRAFDCILNDLLHEIDALETKPQAELKPCRKLKPSLDDSIRCYLNWRASFDCFVQGNVRAVEWSSALLLQLWRLLVDMMLLLDLNYGETAFDGFLEEFDMSVHVAERFLQLSYPSVYIESRQRSSAITRAMMSRSEPRTTARHSAQVRFDNMRSGFLGVCPSWTPLKQKELRERIAARQTTNRLLQLAHLDCLGSLERPNVVSASGNGLKPVFTFSHGIVYPLYVTTTRCRDINIRLKAWEMLDVCKRREGLWDSQLAAKLALRIIRIEHAHEAHCTNNLDERRNSDIHAPSTGQVPCIPNDARIRLVKPTFLANRKSIERYYFSWPDHVDRSSEVEEIWLEETLEW